MSKKAIVVLVPSLLFGIGAPAWSGASDQATPKAQVTPAGRSDNTLLGMLSSILTATDTGSRKEKNKCIASNMYSGHDVVGDPEGCFMGRYNLSSGSATVTSAP
jgi:hypothetical protein